MLTADEIRRNSVAEITSRDTYINNKPVIGGLFDPRMGVLDAGTICPTDGYTYIDTPGYFGHIEMARPVFFIQHLKESPISPFLDRREDLFKWTVTLHNKVNKTLNKPLVSELEAIQFYMRLGKQTRSPVVTPDDFAEADLRAMIKGVALGVAASSVVAASIWYLNKNDTQQNGIGQGHESL